MQVYERVTDKAAGEQRPTKGGAVPPLLLPISPMSAPMRIEEKLVLLCAAAIVAGVAAFPVAAQIPDQPPHKWKGELTPYLWAPGIDGDITVNGRTASIDRSWSDVSKNVDVGGSVLGLLQYGQLVAYGQVDYVKLGTSNLQRTPAGGNLEAKSTIGTLAVGYQFLGSGGKTYDVLVGARRLYMDNTLDLNGVGSFERKKGFTDPLIMFRPSIPFGQSGRWRFNPTVDVGGGGDSKSTYELWPQIQYAFSPNWALRVGYRRLHYKIEKGSDSSWDGNITGLMIGLGGTW